MRHLMAVASRGRAWRFLAEPFEVLIAVSAFISGLAVLTGASRPGSLATQLSPWVLRGWGAGLCAAGVLTLASRWLLADATTMQSLLRAFRLEQIAMTVFATVMGIYALAIMSVGRPGIAAGSIIVGWSGACAVRACIIGIERRAIPSGPAG